MRGKKGTLYFFTGLSGAGKTTIGGLFYRRQKEKRNDIVFLDGDETRPVWNDIVGYSNEDRFSGALRTFRVCKLLTEQGIDAVCCSISMYEAARAWNRENLANYREIYIKVSRETLFRRNKKGLYTSGVKNVLGVDLPFDEPKHSHLVIQNDGEETPEEIVTRIERAFGLAEGEGARA